MSHEQRRRYLQLLGIQPWVPRVVLPGAKPPPLAPEPVTGKGVEPFVAERPATVASAAKQRLAGRHEDNQLGNGAQRKGQTAAQEMPRFRLLSIRFPGDCLLISEVAQDVDWLSNRQVRLVRALISAIGVKSNQFETPLFFHWPLSQNQQIDQGQQEAIAAVEAFIKAQLAEQQVRFVLVMGEVAGRFLLANEAQLGNARGKLWSVLEYPALMTASIGEMLEEPLRKREVWRDIQPLRRLYHDSRV